MLQHTSVDLPRKETTMSTIRSATHTFDIFAEPNLRVLFRRFFTAAQAYWSAAVDGLAAARTYEELTRHGATHAQAVERVFDRHLHDR
jgi:hypothetical protein